MSRINLLTLAAELGLQSEGLLEPSAVWARLQAVSPSLQSAGGPTTSSDDSHAVEQQMQSLEMGTAQSTNSGVTIDIIDEPQGDMSSSGSSWAPGPHSAPDSDSEISAKKIKTDRAKSYAKQKGKKQRRPTLRADPVLPNPTPTHNENAEQSFSSTENGHENRINAPQEFLKPNTPPPINSEPKKKVNTITVKMSKINSIKTELTVVRNMVQKLKSSSSEIKGLLTGSQEDNGHSQSPVTPQNPSERLTPDMGGNVKNDQSQETAMAANTTPRVSIPVDRSDLRDKCCSQPQNIEAGDQSGSNTPVDKSSGSDLRAPCSKCQNIKTGGQSGSNTPVDESSESDLRAPCSKCQNIKTGGQSGSNTPVDESSESDLRDKCSQYQKIEAVGPSGSKNTSCKKLKPIKISNVSGGHVEAESNEMVPIGSGKTLVQKDIYDKINWKSYTRATRKLLMAIFPRSTLATHSLTGKASPAFVTKPAKSCLDPRKVSDIVMTVTAKCHVKEGLVRGAITTKCADENKMLKQRKQKDQRQKSLKASAKILENTENISSPKHDKHSNQ